MSKILFIGEGKKTEDQFCELIIEKYFLNRQKDKEFVSYGTNIYALYNEMNNDSGLDIIGLLKEKSTGKDLEKLEQGGFTEVYLIFDFDPHDPHYNSDKIVQMIEYFDNETENGKLYINYPMFESLKHFETIPDPNFNSYSVNKKECSMYKNIIGGKHIVQNLKKINEEQLRNIVKQNIEKIAELLEIEICEYEGYLEKFKPLELLKFQIKELEEFYRIWVINTSILWGIDYFGKEIYNKYIL